VSLPVIAPRRHHRQNRQRPLTLLKIELDAPTVARVMPIKIKRRDSFSVTNASQRKQARLHQTEPPNALPASWRCPGQPSMFSEIFHSQHTVHFRSWRRPSRLCEAKHFSNDAGGQEKIHPHENDLREQQ
jgi:hypothetical protein